MLFNDSACRFLFSSATLQNATGGGENEGLQNVLASVKASTSEQPENGVPLLCVTHLGNESGNLPFR